MSHPKTTAGFSPAVVFYLVLGRLIGAIAVFFIAVARRKPLGWEWNPTEHLAGVFRTTGCVAALLGRNAVIQHRHNQLSIPLQTDN